MRRLVLGGVVSIAVLLGASIVLLERLYRDGPPSRGPAGAGGGRAEAPMPPAPVVPPGLYEAARAAGLGGSDGAAFDRMAEKQPPRPPPPPDSWEAVPLSAGRQRGRDPVVAAVGRELNELHDELVTCFDPAVAARLGSATPTLTKEDVQDEAGSTVLVLQLETLANQVRVVDAPAALNGGAGDATLACLQAKLRGKVFDAPGAKPGDRRRLQQAFTP